MEDTVYNGKGWFWKPLALFMMGAILSLSMMVAREHLMLRDFITKAEAKEIIKMAPHPWTQDRKYVLKTLQHIQDDVEFIKLRFWKKVE